MQPSNIYNKSSFFFCEGFLGVGIFLLWWFSCFVVGFVVIHGEWLLVV